MNSARDRYPNGAYQLMVAAERLFGELGVEGVTIRELLKAAGQANKSAVHHYFGSKEGLLEAVRDMRLPELEAARARWRERLPPPGKGRALETLAALFLPVLEVMDDQEVESFSQFNLRLLHRPNPEHSFVRMAAASPVTRSLVEQLHACLPGLSADLFDARMRLAVAVLLAGSAEWRRLNMAPRKKPYPSESVFWTDMLVAACSVLEAPSAVQPLPQAAAVVRPAKPRTAAAPRAATSAGRKAAQPDPKPRSKPKLQA